MKGTVKNSTWILTGAAVIAAGIIGKKLLDKMNIGDAKFIDMASAKGIAEIETSRLAMEKSVSGKVKTFAQQMISDHTAVNNELKEIAQRKQISIASDADLMSKAKEFLLKQREGESFDLAYAKHQVTAHKQVIQLFKKATKCEDQDLRNFAATTLKKLEHHLYMAEELVHSLNHTDERQSASDQRNENSKPVSRNTLSETQPTTDNALKNSMQNPGEKPMAH